MMLAFMASAVCVSVFGGPSVPFLAIVTHSFTLGFIMNKHNLDWYFPTCQSKHLHLFAGIVLPAGDGNGDGDGGNISGDGVLQ